MSREGKGRGRARKGGEESKSFCTFIHHGRKGTDRLPAVHFTFARHHTISFLQQTNGLLTIFTYMVKLTNFYDDHDAFQQLDTNHHCHYDHP